MERSQKLSMVTAVSVAKSSDRINRWVSLVSGVLLTMSLAGCSVKQFAIKEIASSLAEGSGSAFAQEADIAFAGEAIPFSLKLV